MKRFSGSQHIERLCDHPTRPKFRSNANRLTINRSNLRVIEAKDQPPKQETNAGNNIEVPCAPLKVNNTPVLKDYDDDLDEISDSPLVDEADEFENVSEGSLCADSDVEDAGHSLEKQIEIPVGYRPYSNQPLTKYKKIAFFKPRLYYVSRHRIVVGCLNTNETHSEVTSVKSEEVVSLVEQDEEVNAEVDIECNENTEAETHLPDEQLPEPFQGKLMIQAELDASEEVILGKEFLVEIWEEPGVTLKNYLCLLCDADLAKDEVIDHFIGIPHRIAYLDKHFPKFTSMFYKNSSLNNSQEKLPIATICKDISDSESALSFITSHAYVSSYRPKLEKEVNKVFHTKDAIVMLLKELCLTVGAKSEEFADDQIDYSSYESVAVSGYVADSPESEEEDGFIVLSVEQDDDEDTALQDDPVDVIHVENFDVNQSEHDSKQQVKTRENSHPRHCSRNRRHRYSHHDEKESTLSTETSRAKSTSGSKSEELSSKSSSSTNVKKSSSSTKHVSSSSKSDSRNKNSVDSKEKSSSHCEKCNGVKKGYVGSKRHAKHCECRKGSSVTTERDAKRKEDSSKGNASGKSEHSRSVNTSSHEKKNSARESSSSAKTKHSSDANSLKVHSSDSRSSRHKGQSVSSRSKDGATEKDEKVGKSSEKKADSVHTKKEKKEGDNKVENHQSRNNDKKSGDSKMHHPSTGHRSRSPRRSRLSPKKSNDAKSVNGSHGGSLSNVRKTKISPVRQNTETSTSRNRKRSPLKSSTLEQKQQKSADDSHNANRNRSRSPRRSLRRRSKSPLANRKRSRSPLATRRRSRSPLPPRRRSRSPLQLRKRSRSPLALRKRSPLLVQKRSRSPLNVSRKRSRSPLTLTRSSNQVVSPRRGSPLQVRVGRFRPVLARKRSRSPIRSNFRRSVSPLNRRWERSLSRSPPGRRTRSISSERDVSYENPYADPPFPVVHDPFQDNVHLPVPPVHPPQPYVPDGFSAPWPVPNPPDNYQYNFPYPPANPAFVPTTYPQYAGHPPQLAPYPNTAFPPPVNQPAPVPPPNPHYAPPMPMPVPPVAVGMPPQNAPPDPRVPVCYPNFEALPPAHNPNEKVFHELRNVVTKLFGVNDSRAPTEAESRNIQKGHPPPNERNFDRSSHSNDIPFLGAAGPSKPLPNQMSPEQQERMFKDALQKLKSEFGAFQIPEEIFKLALKGMFPEHMLNDRAFEIAMAKCLEQSRNQSRSPKHPPNVNARVEFKESSLLPKQGNIFPIVNQNPPFRNEPFANSNNSGGFPDVKQRNINDLDLRVRSNFHGGAHGQGGSGPNNQPEKKTLASRLASVLIKLGMIDVPGPLLSEMLHRIGVFNKSLPLQDITENEIISVLDKSGYLHRK